MICECNIALSNTGVGCMPIQDTTVKLFLVPTFANDGTKNGVPISQIIDDTYLIERLNDADKSKRWYPTLPLKQVTDEREDPETEDIDGMSYITDEGVRNFTGFTISADPVYQGKLDSGKCGELSAFVIDKSGRLVGEISDDGSTLYPIPIERGTFYTKLIKTQQGVIQKVQISFAWSELASDKKLRLMTATADLVNARGLLDINATISGESTTGFVAALTYSYGYANAVQKAIGLLLADFELYNVTTGAPVVITSVTEDPVGTYTFVIPAQTSSDVLRLTDTKNGIELIATVNIP